MMTFFLQTTFFGVILSILGPNPTPEYRLLKPMFGNIMSSLRISVGDFDFTQITILTEQEAIAFWVVWLFIFWFGCLIFLNFIIAEVSSSYENVKGEIQKITNKERATMVKEVEDFFSDKIKNEDKALFPKYFVVREQENWEKNRK